MKKKNIMKAGFAALAVPAMLLTTACGDKVETIDVNRYTELLHESAQEWLSAQRDYKTYNDTTTEMKASVICKSKEEVTYKESAEGEFVTKEFDGSITVDAKQRIMINRDETENGAVAVQVVQEITTVTKGKQANSETDLLEDYERTDVSNVTHTLVKVGEDYKYFKLRTSSIKETGEEEVKQEQKLVHTFANADEFKDAVQSVINEHNNEAVSSFYNNTPDTYLTLKPEFYEGEDAFGFKNGTYSAIESEGYGYEIDVEYTNVETSCEFKGNKPSSTSSKVKMNTLDNTTDINMSATIAHVAETISAPANASEYEDDYLSTSDLIANIYEFMG
ncbi:MAG: hypothetical protein E7356_01265 [Clostridiales bacterium]|nr:hypothetical protein [Clostridiales bacterium]